MIQDTDPQAQAEHRSWDLGVCKGTKGARRASSFQMMNNKGTL